MFGMAPKPDGEGFSPSPLALKVATKRRTDYAPVDYDAYTGAQRVLMVCTEQKYMTMANGRKFSTGNHPVEMLVPLLHLEAAGFEVDVATPTGKPVVVEQWAMPRDDERVQALYETFQPKFERPIALKDVVASLDDTPYGAVLVPGGHGAMLGLPEDRNLATLLRWVMKSERTVLSICHGPAALLADALNDGEFAFTGYEMAVFPDSLDRRTPAIGYMPGHMPWRFGERLRKLGVHIVNKKANGTVHRDRNLVTGDGPDAANAFGSLSAKTLLERMA
ncbi:MAG: molecular chaperone Hsp31 and glyoxalase 3 [Myxococcota bacterium]|jgi:molecular chaperone Hsp31 and glyoxalase 3